MTLLQMIFKAEHDAKAGQVMGQALLSEGRGVETPPEGTTHYVVLLQISPLNKHLPDSTSYHGLKPEVWAVFHSIQRFLETIPNYLRKCHIKNPPKKCLPFTNASSERTSETLVSLSDESFIKIQSRVS